MSREHAAAELGHMFEGQADDDSEDASEHSEMEGEDTDMEEEEEGEEEVEYEEEEDTAENEGEEDETEEAEGGFLFDKDADLSRFGGEDDSEGSEDDTDTEGDLDDTVDDDDEAKRSLTEEGIMSKSSFGEVEKGKAVQRQLSIWDKLLETRIQQQKLLSRVNRLPVGNHWVRLCSGAGQDFDAQLRETRDSTRSLLADLMHLEAVLVSPPLTEEPPRKRKKLSEFHRDLDERHVSARDQRNSTIQLWSDKTRIAGGGKNSFASMETSTVLQINQILANMPRLVERTRVRRSNSQQIGSAKRMLETDGGDGHTAQTDSEIFDDDDFYHQLLRDLIARKTSNSTDQSQVGTFQFASINIR